MHLFLIQLKAFVVALADQNHVVMLYVSLFFVNKVLVYF